MSRCPATSRLRSAPVALAALLAVAEQAVTTRRSVASRLPGAAAAGDDPSIRTVPMAARVEVAQAVRQQVAGPLLLDKEAMVALVKVLPTRQAEEVAARALLGTPQLLSRVVLAAMASRLRRLGGETLYLLALHLRLAAVVAGAPARYLGLLEVPVVAAAGQVFPGTEPLARPIRAAEAAARHWLQIRVVQAAAVLWWSATRRSRRIGTSRA